MAVLSYLKIVGNLYHLLCGLFLALSSAWCDPHGVAVTAALGFALLGMLMLEIPNVLGQKHYFDR